MKGKEKKAQSQMKEYPTQAELQGLFNYVEIQGRGHLQWAKPRRGVKLNSIAGCMFTNKWGYQSERIGINGQLYRSSRLIYTMVRGPIPVEMEVDHIDENSLNNNINNLQLLTHRDNRVKSIK